MIIYTNLAKLKTNVYKNISYTGKNYSLYISLWLILMTDGEDFLQA